MSMIKHHLSDETIAQYAAGHLDQARMVVVATHIDRCETCREASHDFDTIGGVCLETIAPAAMDKDALKTFWESADLAEPTNREVSFHADNDTLPEIVLPLSDYIVGGLDAIKWRQIAPGVSGHKLDAEGYRKGALSLLKISPGTRIPVHSHKGQELTLILRGAYQDKYGTFNVGDIADLGNSHTHSPQAIGDEPCICLIATSAPLVFQGLMGKIIQPFIKL